MPIAMISCMRMIACPCSPRSRAGVVRLGQRVPWVPADPCSLHESEVPVPSVALAADEDGRHLNILIPTALHQQLRMGALRSHETVAWFVRHQLELALECARVAQDRAADAPDGR